MIRRQCRPARVACCAASLAVLAVLAASVPVPAHAHSDIASGVPERVASRAVEATTLSGTVHEWTIDDRVAGAVLRSRAIELADGKLVALDGALAMAAEPGARVRVTGALNGDRLQIESSATESPPTPVAKSTATFTGLGRLLLFHADDFVAARSTFRFELETSANTSIALAVPIEAGVLEPGMRVEVTGRYASDGEAVVPTRIVIHSAPEEGRPGARAKAAPVERVLVVHVKYRDRYGSAPSDPFPASGSRESMFGAGSSVAAFVREASFGQLSIDGDVTPWLVPSTSAPWGCNHTQLGSDARAAATAAGYNLAAYTHQVYVFSGMSCSWSGLSYVGAPHQMWINGRQSTLVFAHEFGHSLGLLHAGSVDCGSKAIGGACSVTEYGDTLGAMGASRLMHYNSMQKSKLGWLPGDGVRSQTTGSAVHRLVPLELGQPGTYAVRVPAMSGRTYWIEYRQPIGFDSALAGLPNNGVQVRVATPFEYNCSGCTALSNDTQLVDLTPQSATNDFDSAMLAVGRRFHDAEGGVIIEVLSATGEYADVSVTVEPAPGLDTDASGTTDLLWWRDSTGELAVWRMNGSAATATRTLVRDPSLSLAGVADIDGDGRTDLLLAQGAGGPINAWTMSGVSITGIVAITSTPGSTVVGIGDFDLDGRDDVVLHEASTGRTSLRLSGAATPAVALLEDPLWRVIAVADFNGDHRADLLWRNAATGAMMIWLMNGATPLAQGSPGTDANLALQFIADLNDDGRADLFFRNLVTGHAIAWLIDGTARVSASTLSTDPAWAAVGAGDVDADGHADLIMRNASSGATAVWLVRNGVVAQKATLFTDPSDVTTHVGDFNGDGRLDLLSRSSSGRTTLRLIKGTAVTSTTQLSADSTWRVINPAPVATGASSGQAGSGSGTTAAPVPTTTTVSSSANPSTVGGSVTFTATVNGTVPSGGVAFKDGAATISGCSAVALTGSGNSRTAQCATSALTQGTHSITAVYAGDAGNQTSTSAALSQVVNAVAASTNVALAANGGVASASSTYSASFGAAGTIDGEVAGAGWGSNRGWNDGTASAYPDWLQVNFSGQKTINKVVVYTVQDNYAAPSAPTDSMTFSLYGITGFQVQTWNGSTWVTQATVSGNNLVKRTVSFAAVATDRIRINVTSALASYARVVEVEAWTP